MESILQKCRIDVDVCNLGWYDLYGACFTDFIVRKVDGGWLNGDTACRNL